MSEELEDLARLFVLGQLDSDQCADFEAQLSSDSALATLVEKIEAALNIQRGLLRGNTTSNQSNP